MGLAYDIFKILIKKENLFGVTELLWGLFYENSIKKNFSYYCKFHMLLFFDQGKIDKYNASLWSRKIVCSQFSK